MRYVIFDTNIVVEKEDFFFSKKDLVKLINMKDIEKFEIYLPKIIIEEIVKKYMEKAGSSIKGLKKFIEDNEKYKFYSEDEFNKSKDELSKEIKNRYKKNLDEIMKNKNIKKIDYPRDSFTVERISKNFFEGNQPFQDGKESFRDAFIWYSILEFSKEINKDDTIYFLTNNTKDFYDKENKTLHEDFKKDLINKEQIILYKSIDDFIHNVKSEINHKLTIEEEIDDYLKDDEIEKYIGSLDEKYFIYISDILNNDKIDTIANDFIESIHPEERNDCILGVDLFAEIEYFNKDEFEIYSFDYEFIGEKEVVINMELRFDILYNSIFKRIDYDPLYGENEFEIYEKGNKTNFEVSIEIYLTFEKNENKSIEKSMHINDVIIEGI